MCAFGKYMCQKKYARYFMYMHQSNIMCLDLFHSDSSHFGRKHNLRKAIAQILGICLACTVEFSNETTVD